MVENKNIYKKDKPSVWGPWGLVMVHDWARAADVCNVQLLSNWGNFWCLTTKPHPFPQNLFFSFVFEHLVHPVLMFYNKSIHGTHIYGTTYDKNKVIPMSLYIFDRFYLGRLLTWSCLGWFSQHWFKMN